MIQESEEEPNEEIEEEPEEVEEPPSFLQQVSVIERKPRKIIVIGWNNKVKIFQVRISDSLLQFFTLVAVLHCPVSKFFII